MVRTDTFLYSLPSGDNVLYKFPLFGLPNRVLLLSKKLCKKRSDSLFKLRI